MVGLHSGCGPYPLKNVFPGKKKTYRGEHAPRHQGYNRGMGGTDLMDQNISRHRIAVKGKKWWWAIFTWMVDMAMQNAWILQCKNAGCHATTLLEFRRNVAQHYILYLRMNGAKATFSWMPQDQP